MMMSPPVSTCLCHPSPSPCSVVLVVVLSAVTPHASTSVSSASLPNSTVSPSASQSSSPARHSPWRSSTVDISAAAGTQSGMHIDAQAGARTDARAGAGEGTEGGWESEEGGGGRQVGSEAGESSQGSWEASLLALEPHLQLALLQMSPASLAHMADQALTATGLPLHILKVDLTAVTLGIKPRDHQPGTTLFRHESFSRPSSSSTPPPSLQCSTTSLIHTWCTTFSPRCPSTTRWRPRPPSSRSSATTTALTAPPSSRRCGGRRALYT